ncbi:MAG TPA: MraY family glycosyltransferase [Longilinea sp.]|nr:MraY family glycosyltransferase [Longilinea sp.]
MTVFSLLLVVFLSVTLALGLSPLAIWFSHRVGLMDIPRSEGHKQHNRPVPLAGGIVLFLTFLILSLIGSKSYRETLFIHLLPIMIIVAFGILDDFIGLKPVIKLVGQFLAAGLLIYNGVSAQLFSYPVINFAITIFWLVGITNAFNFIDSMDGLAAGLAALTAACLVLVTLLSGQVELTLMSTLILGSCIGVFFFNSPPARYFLGDSGAQFLGFSLAAITLEYIPAGFTLWTSWFVPVLLVSIPIFDMVLVVVSRLRRRLPVYQGNLDHTYHRLIRLGINPNRAILVMQLSALLIDCLAFILLNLTPVLANGLVAVLGLTGIGLIIFLDRPHLLDDNPYPTI